MERIQTMNPVNKLNPEAYARVLDVVRKADLLVDSTFNGGMESQFVSQNAWLELSHALLALRNIIPIEEKPAETPHAVVLFWPEMDSSNERLNEDEVLSAALTDT
jgi:hypothetical protein